MTDREQYASLAHHQLVAPLFLISNYFPEATLIKNQKMITVLNYIHNHIKEPITLRDLCAVANMEDSYLRRIFKKEVNISPYQYIKNIRLHIGITRLRMGFSVSEAAWHAGYESVYTFSNTIKTHTGLSPSQLKNEQRSDC